LQQGLAGDAEIHSVSHQKSDADKRTPVQSVADPVRIVHFVHPAFECKRIVAQFAVQQIAGNCVDAVVAVCIYITCDDRRNDRGLLSVREHDIARLPRLFRISGADGPIDEFVLLYRVEMRRNQRRLLNGSDKLQTDRRSFARKFFLLLLDAFAEECDAVDVVLSVFAWPDIILHGVRKADLFGRSGKVPAYDLRRRPLRSRGPHEYGQYILRRRRQLRAGVLFPSRIPQIGQFRIVFLLQQGDDLFVAGIVRLPSRKHGVAVDLRRVRRHDFNGGPVGRETQNIDA